MPEADFEKLYGGVGPQNYNWYQRKFIELGYSLYPDFKTSLIEKVLANYSDNGKNLNSSDLLNSLAPKRMDEWQKEMQ